MNKTLKMVLLPTVVMIAFLAVVLVSERGAPLTYRAPLLDMLDESYVEQDTRTASTAVVYLSEDANAPAVTTLKETLEQVALPFQVFEADKALPELSQMSVLLYCSQDLTPLAGCAEALNTWLNGGGRLAFLLTPQFNPGLQLFSRKLGIRELGNEYLQYNSLRFSSGLFALWDPAKVYDADGQLADYALTVRLDPECTVYMTTGDASAIPLLWTRDVGRGRVAVSNNSLVSGKDSRGLALQVLLAVEDTFAYPIVNAGMVFIDDFPAPQPEGYNDMIRAQFGYDTQSFFRNHWWPDMKRLTWNDGIRYTGVLVETYNDNVTGPFVPDTEDHSLIRYYTSELLQSGGEIGLHGYNHQPLCPDGFPYAGENYTTWPSAENMRLATKELLRYGSGFLLSAMFRTYVPPSNYLSGLGQETLLEAVPQLRTISGVYLPENGVNALVQEFREEEDGSVSVPRITAGFAVDDYNAFVAAQELLLHGVFSHFIHPDDVLDPERGADLGWTVMYQRFSAFLQQIRWAYPQLMWSTASEGSAAVQRYDRLKVRMETGDDGVTLWLSPFYDEAWVAVKTGRPLAEADGSVFRVSDSLYWVCARAETVRLPWEVEE